MDDWEALQAKYEELKAYVTKVAEQKFGWDTDATFDLPRVWKLPGTTNRKVEGDHRSCYILEEGGAFTSLDDLLNVAQASQPEPTPAPPVGNARQTERDGTWTPEHAEKEIGRLLAEVSGRQQGEGFNNTLNNAALRIGRFVNGGFLTYEDAAERLYLAVEKVFGAADRTDTGTIASGLNAASKYAAFIIRDGKTDEAAVTVAPANIPAAFWEARPELKHIRDAAHNRGRSADAVLGGVLARLAAKVDHRMRCDTGVGNPASLNLISAIVSKSGGGKSSAASIPKALIPDEDLEERPLGSGEGMAEAYMGQVALTKAKTNEDGTTEQVADGNKKVKKQVRHNLLLTKDEGMELVKVLERTGATVAEALRSAWSGETIGQSNGTVETTRIIREGSYALGIVIGFQEEAAVPLLSAPQVAVGTPQRFVWFNASDPSIPLDPPADPGSLTVFRWESLAIDSTIGTGRVMSMDEELKREIRLKDWLRNRDDGSKESRAAIEEMAGVNSHKPLTLIKISCLLALLAGRYHVTRDDWDLAVMVWDTSCLIRKRIQLTAQTEAERASKEALKKAHARSKAGEQGKQEVAKEALEGAVERLRACFARQSEWTAGKLKNELRSDARGVFTEAIEALQGAGEVDCREGGRSVVWFTLSNE